MLEINPYNVQYVGSGGFALVCIGEYEKGLSMMSEAIDLNPYYNWYINIGLCLYFLVRKDFEEALHWAKLINRKNFFWDTLLNTATLGLMNDENGLSKNIHELNELVPNFEDKAEKLVAVYLYDPILQQIILKGLKLAGMEIKDNLEFSN